MPWYSSTTCNTLLKANILLQLLVKVDIVTPQIQLTGLCKYFENLEITLIQKLHCQKQVINLDTYKGKNGVVNTIIQNVSY